LTPTNAVTFVVEHSLHLPSLAFGPLGMPRIGGLHVAERVKGAA